MITREFLLEYNRRVTVDKFSDRILARGETDEPENLIKLFEEIDPTQNKQYVVWMVQRYVQGEFGLDDLVQLKNALYKFEYAKFLNLDLLEPDLGRYKFAKLIETIDKLFPNDGVFPVIPDTTIIWNGPTGQFVSPRTVEASQALQKLGPSTKWCTADSRAPNHFARYVNDGPLYIWIDADNRTKIQFHPASGQISTPENLRVRDEALMTYLLNKPFINRVILPELINNRQMHYYIPDDHWTKEIAERIVSVDGASLQFIPPRLITLELAQKAIQHTSTAIRSVPKKILEEHPELYTLAVQSNGRLLSIVPKELRTPELVKLAAASDPESIQYAPEWMLTPEFITSIGGNIIEYLPIEYWNQERVNAAVIDDPRAFYVVARRAPEYLTDELIDIGFKEHGTDIIWHLPENFLEKNPDRAMKFIRREPGLIRHVPLEKRTKEMLDYVVSRSGIQLARIPLPERTLKQSVTAVRRNGMALEFVPLKFRSTALCMMAVSNNGKALQFVPEAKRTPKMIFTAYDNNKKAMRYLPEQYRTSKMYRTLIKRNPYGIMYMPAKFVDREIVRRVIEANTLWYKYVPDSAKIKYPDLSDRVAISMYDWYRNRYPASPIVVHINSVANQFPEKLKPRITRLLNRLADRSNGA